MKTILLATSALMIAVPAAAEITLTGTFDFDWTVDDKDRSDVDLNTLTFSGGINASNVTGTAKVGFDSSITGKYSLYADVGIGKIGFGTIDGTSTDDDLTETAQTADWSLGQNEITDFASTLVAASCGLFRQTTATCQDDVWDTGDGPVDNTLAVANSVSKPSVQFSAPALGPFTTALTMATSQENYILSIGYDNDATDIDIDVDDEGDMVMSLKQFVGVGNFLFEYDQIGSADADYELRFETDLSSVGTPLQMGIYTDSDETSAIEMRYLLDGFVEGFGIEYTSFGADANTLTPIGQVLKAANKTDSLDYTMGGGVQLNIADTSVRFTYEEYEAVDGSGNDSIKIAADFTDDITVTYDDNTKTFNMDISTTF